MEGGDLLTAGGRTWECAIQIKKCYHILLVIVWSIWEILRDCFTRLNFESALVFNTLSCKFHRNMTNSIGTKQVNYPVHFPVVDCLAKTYETPQSNPYRTCPSSSWRQSPWTFVAYMLKYMISFAKLNQVLFFYDQPLFPQYMLRKN
jgi:hypothetical protein